MPWHRSLQIVLVQKTNNRSSNMESSEQPSIDRSVLESDIQLGEKLEKLRASKEFKAIFEDLYFKEEVVRLTMLIDAVRPDSVPAIYKELGAISTLNGFLYNIEQKAETAKADLAYANNIEKDNGDSNE